MSDPSPVVTAIVEDHPLFRDAIAAVVDSMPELRLGPVVADADRAIEAFSSDPPGLVLVDYSLVGMDAPELIVQIHARWPATKCIVLSGHVDDERARRSLEAGAAAYVLKGRPDEFRVATEEVLSGATYVSPAVSAE